MVEDALDEPVDGGDDDADPESLLVEELVDEVELDELEAGDVLVDDERESVL